MYEHTYCIFKYSLIRPTSAFKKTHNRRTLGLLLNRLKLALFLEGKKKVEEQYNNKPILTQFFHVLITRNHYAL